MSALSVIRQFEYETEQWRLMLLFIEEENVCFKHKLSELLNEDVGAELVEMAERFLEDFVAQDHVIRYLNCELKNQRQLLKKEYSEVDTSFLELMDNQIRLRKDIEKEQSLFQVLKSDFELYLCKDI